MRKKQQQGKMLIFSLALILVIVIAVICRNLSEPEEEQEVNEFAVSLESGFYAEDQEIQVDVPKGSSVFYTDNCEEPDGENGYKYESPISVVAPEEELVFVYRFKAFYDDGRESPVITRTYFMGSNIDSRYTTNVLHITGEPDDLFGYENGIFVKGKIFDEFIKENPDIHFGGGVEANFNWRGREYEREVYIEYFSVEGKPLFAVNGGVRIHGDTSQMKNQKSFKLYARSEYDSVNEFRYPVLSELTSLETGAVARKHKRLLVRSGGTDNGFGFIRSELAMELANAAGFPDVMLTEPVCVYINGTYRGIYWLENIYDRQYFENRYGEYFGEFIVLGKADKEKTAEDDAELRDYVNEYNEFYQKFAGLDLTVEENFEELQKFLDVENYLQYFAINNYIGNGDWPHKNVKAYRYVAGEDGYRENSVFDGRYRHLLYDLDHAFGLLMMKGTVGIYPEKQTLERILSDEAPLFRALMQRKDCRDYFAGYTCDLINGAMSPENVAETLYKMDTSRDAELYHMLEETDLMEDSLWNWEEEPDYESTKESCEDILAFAEKRPAAVRKDLSDTFGLDTGKLYTLHVSKSSLSDIRLNSMTISDAEFSGIYFGEIPVVLEPVLATNEVFLYWRVNGKICEQERLELTFEDVVEGGITVELAVDETEKPVLQLEKLRTRGSNDFVELINISSQPIRTFGYFLSDSHDLHKYALPDLIVQPGETLRLYGKSFSGTEALGQYGLNFNLKQGETLTLSYENDVLESLFIPELAPDSLYQRKGSSGKFMEIMQSDAEE